MAGWRDTWVRSNLIPDHPPDPKMQADVYRILGLNKKERPKLEDGLPEGLSDADPPPPPPPPEGLAAGGLKMPPAPQPRPADETMPAFGKITRFALADLPKMPWLIPRLQKAFPHVPHPTWQGRLRGFTVDNSYLFVCSERAVLLATVARDPFAVRPHVLPLFLFHNTRGPEGGNLAGSDGEREAIGLLREAARWGKQMGAAEVRHVTEHSDVPAGAIMHLLQANWLHAERRDEIVLVIRP